MYRVLYDRDAMRENAIANPTRSRTGVCVFRLCRHLQQSSLCSPRQAQRGSTGTLGNIVEDLRLLGPVVDSGEGSSGGGKGRHGGLCDCEERHCVRVFLGVF